MNKKNLRLTKFMSIFLFSIVLLLSYILSANLKKVSDYETEIKSLNENISNLNSEITKIKTNSIITLRLSQNNQITNVYDINSNIIETIQTTYNDKGSILSEITVIENEDSSYVRDTEVTNEIYERVETTWTYWDVENMSSSERSNSIYPYSNFYYKDTYYYIGGRIVGRRVYMINEDGIILYMWIHRYDENGNRVIQEDYQPNSQNKKLELIKVYR